MIKHRILTKNSKQRGWGRYILYLLGMLACFILLSCSSQTPTELQWQQEQGYRWAEIEPGSAGDPGFNRVPSSHTGIHFTNHVSKEDIAGNEYYLNGSGVAAADVDGDGLVDLYFAQLDGPNRLYKNLGDFEFREITDSAGVAHTGSYSTGVVFADVDNDHDSDLFISSLHNGVTLYLNDGRGRFEPDRQSEFSTTRGKGSTTLALADIDEDGDLDLYVTNYNEGKEKPGQQRGEKDQLFLNDGTGRFTEAADMERRFLDREGNPAGVSRDWGLAAKFQDLNGDGLPDLYVCNDFWTPDRIWINQGAGVFKAAHPHMVANTSYSSMSVDFSDINRDGAVDLFVTDMLSPVHERRLHQYVPEESHPGIHFDADRDPQYRRNSLYLNRGDHTFAEIAYYSGVEASGWSWTTRFMDVDLDGFEDLLINTGFSHNALHLDTRLNMNLALRQSDQQSILDYPRLELPNHAFRNNGDLTFSDVSRDWGFEESDISHGMAVADLDRDGDLDLVSNRLNQTATVFENRTGAPRIAVRLAGYPDQTPSIGAKIALTGGPVDQNMQITAGGDYLSGSEPLAVFAADPSNPDHQLTITWTGGEQSIIDSLQAGRLYEIQNPKTIESASPSSTDPPLFEEISGIIDHTHRESDFGGDFELQPLLPYHLSRMGPGLSWIDYDRDGDDDLFVAAGRGQPTGVYRNDGSGNFQPVSLGNLSRPAPGDQTTILGWGTTGGTRLLVGSANYEQGSMRVPLAYSYTVEEPEVRADSLRGVYSTTGPMAAADYDADGDIDLFVGGRFLPFRYPQSANSRLFTNTDGAFRLDDENSKIMEQVGLVTGAVFSDYDLDGDPDLLLSTEWGSLKLFQNQQGRFREVTQAAGLGRYKGWWNGVATGDFNNDGRPDIVATNIGRNSPYQIDSGPPLKMYYSDFNGDSRMDIIEAYYNTKRKAYVPRRQLLAFESISRTVLQNVNSHTEFAHATLQEILGMDPEQLSSKNLNTVQHMVFLNEGGTFSAHPLPPEAQFAAAFSVNVADLDNDGHEDLFLSQNLFSVRPQLPRLDAGRGLWLKGDGQGHFTPLPGQKTGIKIYGEQRGAALSDFNADGRVDLAVAQNNGPTRLFVNRTEERGLRIQLVGPPENRDAFGSSMRLIYQDGQKGPRREIQAGSGYWSQNSATQVMGRAEEVKAVEVSWFDGSKRTVDIDIDIDKNQQRYVIRH